MKHIRHMKKTAALIAVLCLALILSSIGVVFAKYQTSHSRQVEFNIKSSDYTIVFHANAPAGKTASGTMADQTVSADTPTPLNKNEFEIQGTSFVRWNTEPDGSGTPYDDEEEITIPSGQAQKTVHLYAIWGAYEVHFNSNFKQSTSQITYTGTGKMSNQSFLFGESKALSSNTYVLKGKTSQDEYYVWFAGWNTEPDGTGTHYTNEEVVQDLTNVPGAVVELYAEWRSGYVLFTQTTYKQGGTFTIKDAEDDEYLSYEYEQQGGQFEKTNTPIVGLEVGKWYSLTYEFENSGHTGHNDDDSGYYATISTAITTYKQEGGNNNSWYHAKAQFMDNLPDGTSGGNWGFMDKFENFRYNTGTIIFRADAPRMYWTFDYSAVTDGQTPIMTLKEIDFHELYIPTSGTYVDFVNTSFSNVTMSQWNAKVSSGASYGTFIQNADASSMHFYLRNDKGTGGKMNIPLKGLTVGETYTVSFDIDIPGGFRTGTQYPLGFVVSDSRVTDTSHAISSLTDFHTIDKTAGASSHAATFTATAETMYLAFDISGIGSAWQNIAISNAELMKGYTVTYNSNQPSGASTTAAGTMPTDGVAEGRSIVVKPCAYTLGGYHFTGWNTEADGSGTEYQPDVILSNLTDAVILYAQWQPNSYTVNYDANAWNFDGANMQPAADGSASVTVPSQNVTFDTVPAAVVDSQASRTGYTFTGWNTKADGTGTAYASGDSLNISTLADGESLTLYAQWGNYKITYAFADSVTDNFIQFYSNTDAVTLLGTPSKAGYTFAGWKTGSSRVGTWAANTTRAAETVVAAGQTGNPTMTAQWTKNTYYIAFDGSNPTTGTMSNLTCTYDTAKTLTANAFKKNGYNFAGWATAPGGEAEYANQASVKNLTTEPGETVTLYAVWTPVTYTITYAPNSGTLTGDAKQNYTIEDDLVLQAAASRGGYRFSKWKVTSSTNGAWTQNTLYDAAQQLGTDTMYGTPTLTAQWTANTYSVIFDENAADAAGTMTDESFTYDAAKNLTQNAYTRTGYTFVCWNTKADGSGTVYTDKQSVKNLTTEHEGTVTLYAQWSNGTFTVHFDANAPAGYTATGTTADKTPYTYNSTELTANGFKIENYYDFDNWNTQPDGTGITYANKSKLVKADAGQTVTLYAQWTPKNHTVKYSANGGILSGGATQIYNCANSFNLQTAPTRTGYTFTGWKVTGANGNWLTTDPIYAAEQEITAGSKYGTPTLTAQWSQDQYTIHYEGNDPGTSVVTGTMADTTGYKYNSTELRNNAFSAAGYTFSGWNTQPDGSGDAYGNKSKLVIGADGSTVTLYAQWTPITYYVAFNANDGTGTMAKMTMIYDQPVNLTANAFTRTGYTYTGWNTVKAGTGTAYADEASVSNLTTTNGSTVTLYAQWRPNTYTVVFNTGTRHAVSGTMVPQTHTYNAAQNLTENAYSRVGYTFNGWVHVENHVRKTYNDKASVKNLTAIDGGTYDLDAMWTVITYTITYDANGGTLAGAGTQTYNIVTGARLQDEATKTGAYFAGWKVTASSNSDWNVGDVYPAAYFVESGITGNVTLQAQWSETPVYNAAFNANGGEGEMMDQLIATGTSTALRKNTFTYEGYTFAGWNTMPDGSGTSYADEEQVTDLAAAHGETVTLYAQWTADEEENEEPDPLLNQASENEEGSEAGQNENEETESPSPAEEEQNESEEPPEQQPEEQSEEPAGESNEESNGESNGESGEQAPEEPGES